MAADWHYAKGGQRHGPVTMEQLRQLAATGQLQPSDLVWQKGMPEWQKAESTDGLFPSQTSESDMLPPLAAAEWHYSKGGQQHGSITEEQLRGLAVSGQLQPADLVWRKGLADWQKATLVEGLFPKKPAIADGPPSLPQTASFVSTMEGFTSSLRTFAQSNQVREATSHPVFKPVLIVVSYLTICLSPIGLYLVWTTSQWTTQRKWLWTAPLLVYGFLVLGNMGGESGRSGDTPISSSVASTSGLSNTTDGYGIGDEFQLGDYKYRITDANRRSNVGNQFINEQASAGATFLIVSYTIENCTNKTQTVLSEDFTLVDGKGREFRPSSDVNTALLAGEDKDFLLSELQPGIPRRMSVGFEVPESIPLSEFTLSVPEKGLFSSGKMRVRLADQ